MSDASGDLCDFLFPFDFFVIRQESCAEKPNLQALYAKYQECNDRVNSKKETAETCAEELHDYIHELDHCVNHTLFSKLK